MKKIVALLLVFSNEVMAKPVVDTGIDANQFWKVMLGLFFVLVCIIVLAYVVKKVNGIGLTNHHFFQVISGVAIGTKERLLLVKAGDEYFIIGVSQGGISKIHDYGEKLKVDDELKSNFSQTFKKIIKNKSLK